MQNAAKITDYCVHDVYMYLTLLSTIGVWPTFMENSIRGVAMEPTQKYHSPKPAANAVVVRTPPTPTQLAQVSGQAFGSLSLAFNSFTVRAVQMYSSYFSKQHLSPKDIERQEAAERFKNLERQIAIAETEFDVTRKAYETAKKETAATQVSAVQRNSQAYDKLVQILYSLSKLKNLDYSKVQPEDITLTDGVDGGNEQRERLAIQLQEDIALLFNALKEMFTNQAPDSLKNELDSDRFLCSKTILFSTYESVAQEAQKLSELLRRNMSEENRLKREMESKKLTLDSLLDEQLSLQGKRIVGIRSIAFTPNDEEETEAFEEIPSDHVETPPAAIQQQHLLASQQTIEEPEQIIAPHPSDQEQHQATYIPPNGDKPSLELLLMYQVRAGLLKKV